jgi:ATP-binding cassette subfamily B protein
MMLTISWSLTLFVLATLPLYVVATVVIDKNSQKYFAAQQKELGNLSSHVEEMYTGHKVVKAFGREQVSIDHFEAVNNRLYDSGWKAQFISGVMFPAMNFVSNLGYVLISVVGGMGITQNWLKIGDITAFIQYARNFTMPIVQTANIANIIQSTVACAERVFEILDEVEEGLEQPGVGGLEGRGRRDQGVRAGLAAAGELLVAVAGDEQERAQGHASTLRLRCRPERLQLATSSPCWL